MRFCLKPRIRGVHGGKARALGVVNVWAALTGRSPRDQMEHGKREENRHEFFEVRGGALVICRGYWGMTVRFGVTRIAAIRALCAAGLFASAASGAWADSAARNVKPLAPPAHHTP